MKPINSDASKTIFSGAEYLAFPVSDNVRTYANGDIKIMHLNTYFEPAGGASSLMVIYPRKNDNYPHARIISLSDSVRFSYIYLSQAKSAYDPATGLKLTIPVSIFDGATDEFVMRNLTFTINQASEEIIVEELTRFSAPT